MHDVLGPTYRRTLVEMSVIAKRCEGFQLMHSGHFFGDSAHFGIVWFEG